MLSVQLPPEGAGRIACRVVHSVLAFHHRAAVQVVPVVGTLAWLRALRMSVRDLRGQVGE